MAEPKETVHGGDIYRNPSVTDYSVNSNPLGVPEAVRKSVQESADRIMYYPDVRCDRLRESISDFERIEKEKILCGNGAAELFFAVVMAVRPKKALVTAPAFSEYERALGTVGAEVQYYRLKEEQDFRIQEDILEQITEDTDMIFLCNPNNPTGQTTEKELLIRVMNRCNKCGTILVLDECFIEFLEEPERYECRGYLTQYPNVVIIKAFTKIFCMPGVRLGYALCENAALRKRMRAMLQPWNVSVTAQEAGVAALVDCEAYLKRTREYIKKEKFSSMFPDQCTTQQVLNSIHYAIKHTIPCPSNSPNWLQCGQNKPSITSEKENPQFCSHNNILFTIGLAFDHNGKINTAFPIFE